jgi:hypothetical protein
LDEALEALQRFQNVGSADAVAAELVLALRRHYLQVGDALGDGGLKAVVVQIIGEVRIAGRRDFFKRNNFRRRRGGSGNGFGCRLAAGQGENQDNADQRQPVAEKASVAPMVKRLKWTVKSFACHGWDPRL